MGGEDGFPDCLRELGGEGGVAQAGQAVNLHGLALEADDDVERAVGSGDAEGVARAEAEGGGFTLVDGGAEGFGETEDVFGVGEAGGAEDREAVE